MPDKPNNPFQFWQELKRRKVISFVSVVVIVALVLFHIMSSRKQAIVDTNPEKSIAVLPSKSLSDDPDCMSSVKVELNNTLTVIWICYMFYVHLLA